MTNEEYMTMVYRLLDEWSVINPTEEDIYAAMEALKGLKDDE